MPISFQPSLASHRAADGMPGRLVVMRLREQLRIGFLAKLDEREGLYLIPISQGERQFAPTSVQGQSFVDLGDEIQVDCMATVESIELSGNDRDDLLGALMVGGEGVAAMVVAPLDGDMRYYDFVTGNVTFARPDARAIVKQWGISVGPEGRRQKIATVIARPLE